jgi:hypothetical protein
MHPRMLPVHLSVCLSAGAAASLPLSAYAAEADAGRFGAQNADSWLTFGSRTWV